MKLFLAIGWSFIMISSIIECAFGAAPTWFDVFVPLSVVLCDGWLDWAEEKVRKKTYRDKFKNLD